MKLVIQKREEAETMKSYKWEARGYRKDGSEWFVVAYKTKKEALEANKSFADREDVELIVE